MSTLAVKTIDDLFSEVRQILNDEQITYRYTDAHLLQFYNTALREIYRLRPDAYIGNFTSGVLSKNAAPTFVAGDLAQTPAINFPLDDRIFYGPVVFYMAGRAELNDDEFADSGRSMVLMQAFRAQLVGPGG